VDGHAVGDSSFIASCESQAREQEQQATKHPFKQAESSLRGGRANLPMLMINAAALMLAKADTKMRKTLQRVRRAREQGLILTKKARSTMPVAELVNNALDLQRRALRTADEMVDGQLIVTVLLVHVSGLLRASEQEYFSPPEKKVLAEEAAVTFFRLADMSQLPQFNRLPTTLQPSWSLTLKQSLRQLVGNYKNASWVSNYLPDAVAVLETELPQEQQANLLRILLHSDPTLSSISQRR
jgi:hypothetical protein